MRYLEVEPPERKPGEVLIRVRAAPLNWPDLLMTRGEYQFKPDPPFIPGLELAGDVLEADPECEFQPGMRVYGSSRLGAMASHMTVAATALRRIPGELWDSEAACLGAAYGTAYTGLVEIGGLKPGQWVLVHGASGGVGLAACDLARALGANVIAATGSPHKLEQIRAACQPFAAIDSSTALREQIAAITGGKMCDLVYDPVGGDVFDESTRCVTFGGKLLVIGFTSGRIATIPSNIPLIKGFSIVGVRAGEYARRFPERGLAIRDAVHDLAERGAIKPHVDRTLPLGRWREAFEAMARRELVGKVVLMP